MRRETRAFQPAGLPIVELLQVRLQAAVAAGRVPEASARIAESHLAALQVSPSRSGSSPRLRPPSRPQRPSSTPPAAWRCSMAEDLQAIRDRVRGAWTTHRVCGLVGIAATLRIDRLIALDGAGRIARADALRMAYEAEAVALCFAPLPWL